MPEDDNRITVDREQSPLLEFEELFDNVSSDRERRQIDNELLRSNLKDRKSDRKLRRRYANRILLYLYVYSGFVGILIICSAWSVRGFMLDESIMATLVGSTAIAAIGLVGFIAKGLFK